MAIPIALVNPIWRDSGVLGTTHRICLSGQDLIDEIRQHLARQVWKGLRQKFSDLGSRVDMIENQQPTWVSSFRKDVGIDSKGTRDGRLYAHRHKAYRGLQIHHTKRHNLRG